MEEERTQRYKKRIVEIEKVLNEKELGPELEEVFSYYLEVLKGNNSEKKYYVSMLAEELISKVTDFPEKSMKRPRR